MTEPDMALRSVFVYGTLMPGERWEKVAQQGLDAQNSSEQDLSAEPAWLEGVALADLRPEGYPALFPDTELVAERPAGGKVSGWLYTYTPQAWRKALPFLDELEGLDLTPPLYRREQVKVQTAQGPKPAWVYFYARAGRRQAPGFLWVESGNWQDVPGRDQEGERGTWEG